MIFADLMCNVSHSSLKYVKTAAILLHLLPQEIT